MKPAALMIIALFATVLVGCNGSNDTGTTGTVSPTSSSDPVVVDGTAEMDIPEVTYDSNDTADETDPISSVSNNIVLTSGQDVTIDSAGVYYLSGTASDCSIIVNAKDQVVQLILNGIDISCSDYAPIFIMKAEKVIITLADGSVNTITDGSAYTLSEGEDEPSATIFSKADLTINSSGSLTVNANYNNGIQSKDLLKIMKGNITVNSVDDGIVGKDGIAFSGGTLEITSGGDGLKSTNEEEQGLGYIIISDCTVKINSNNDSIDAATVLGISGGTINVVSGGGHEVQIDTDLSAKGLKANSTIEIGLGTVTIDSADDGIHSNGTINLTGGEITVFSSKDGISGEGAVSIGGSVISITSTAPSGYSLGYSMKGVKSATSIVISGGYLTVNTADDTIHSNGTIVISGGEMSLTSGDDGVHADTSLTISGGLINITKSYEGLESKAITISSGTIYVNASDDGLNAAGGNDSSSIGGRPGQNPFSSGTGSITISGGYTVVNASGDGVDANGSITMTAGTVIVYGPLDNGNGALDYDSTFLISGGYLIACGSSGMAQAPSSSSSQYSISITFTSALSSGTAVSISGNDESIIIVPIKNFTNIVISTPELATGSYSVSYNGSYDGDNVDGIVDGSYSGGTVYKSFSVSSKVTTVGSSGSFVPR
jgi:hypothetical protein